MTALTAPRKLSRADERTWFECAAAELGEWLRKYAWQSQTAGNATTYVITDSDRVVGCYAIAMAAVARAAAPQPFAKNRSAQIPCILLARLAVDSEYAAQGLGRELLRDALIRSVQLSGSIGAAAVLLHCRDTAAKSFYLRHSDFLSSPIDDLQLMMPVRALAAGKEC